jgi:hypothetical protein
MSSCAASYSTCSPRASSASATSASSPTEGVPFCCRCALPLSAQFHRELKPKPRPLQLLTRCGAVPSAVRQWSSSNHSQRHNSNSVLHRGCSWLHEITCPQPQLPLRCSASGRSVSPSPLDTSFTPSDRTVSNGNSPSRTAALPLLRTSTPLSPLSICITPASAAQRLPSDGFFEDDAAHLPSASSTHPGVVSEKALASSGGMLPPDSFHLAAAR